MPGSYCCLRMGRSKAAVFWVLAGGRGGLELSLCSLGDVFPVTNVKFENSCKWESVSFLLPLSKRGCAALVAEVT